MNVKIAKSAKEAKSLNLKKYFTGKPCKFGHVAERFVANRECIVCHTLRKTNVKLVVEPIKMKTVRVVEFHNPLSRHRVALIAKDYLMEVRA